MKAFDNSSRDPRVHPATGDIVIPAGKKRPIVPVWAGGYSAIFGNGGDNISFVYVNPDCKDSEEAERRISKRKGLSLKFCPLDKWRRMMDGGEVLCTNDEPYVVWDDDGSHQQPSKEDPEYIQPQA